MLFFIRDFFHKFVVVLPVAFKSSNESIGSIKDNQFTITGPGNITITAEQNGDKNFKTASVIRSLNIRVVTSLGELSFSDITEPYPNPSSGVFNLDAISCFESFEIINSIGLVVGDNVVIKEDGRWLIDLSGSPFGVYYVRITGCKSLLSFKLIKQ